MSAIARVVARPRTTRDAAVARARVGEEKMTSRRMSSSSSSSSRSTIATRARSRATSAPFDPTTSAFDARDALRRADEARVLVSEITAIAASAGTPGAARTASAVESLARLVMRSARELDVRNPPTPPEMVRKTFEALGATYVKLGQFIASAPSVFPKEYVDELSLIHI